MTDFQRIADNVRSIVHSTDSASADAVAEVAEEYFSACEDANRRLLQCSGLLRQGLRSEAIQQAETEPKLLDAVALLDLPEIDVWRELLRENGLETPESLMLDVAAELNEAYAAEQPLAGLLRQHRLQALARSPLSKRIETLRQIRRLDDENPVWEEDHRSYEKVRHDQIRHEADEAYRDGDLETLESLKNEIGSSSWQDSPSRKVVRAISNQHATLSKTISHNEMKQLIEPLERAYSELDADAGRQVRERWEQYAGVAELDEADPLIERADPALDWLAEEDKRAQADRDFQIALAELEAALDDGSVKRPEFERLGHAVFRHERSVPDVLERRYHQRLAALELGASRRTKIIIAGISGAAICLMLAIGWLIFRQLHGQQVAGAKTALESLVEEDRFEEAESYLDTLKTDQPRVFRSREIQALTVLLTKRIEDESERRNAFRQALDRGREKGAEDPDRAALAEAGELAKTESELAEVAEFEADVAEVNRQRQRDRDDAFMEQLEGLLARQREVKQLHETDFWGSRDAVVQLKRDLYRLLEQGRRVNPPRIAAGRRSQGVGQWAAR